MILRASFSAVVAASSVFASAAAFASSKKTNSSGSISGAVPKSGTLVAMGGSGTLGSSSGSRGSYVGLDILPFKYVGLKTTQKSTTVETPITNIRTMPKTLEFYGHFGSYSVRPQLSLENDTLSSIGLGYDVSSNLEIGGFLGYSRNSTKQADTEAVSSSVAVGPRAYYYTEIAGFPVEAEAAFLLGFGTAETTTKGTTTKTKDESSIAFEVKAKIVKELSSGLEYVGGVGYGYESLTKKKNDTDQKEESTISGMSLNITPAGLRYSF